MASTIPTIEMDRDDLPVMFASNSGMVSELGHDVFENMLYVVFRKNGKIARYSDVERDVFFGLKDADSAYTFMRENIIDQYETAYVSFT